MDKNNILNAFRWFYIDKVNPINSKIDELSKKVDEMGTSSGMMKNLLNTLYPVGSIYIETTNTNPGAKLGGTWEAYGKSDEYLRLGGNGSGGSNSYSLTANNIPSHTHSVGTHTHGLNSHTHSIGSHTHKYVKATGVGAHRHTYGFAFSDYYGQFCEFGILHNDSWYTTLGGVASKNVAVNYYSNTSTKTVNARSTAWTANSGSTTPSLTTQDADTGGFTAYNTGGASGNTKENDAFNSGAYGASKVTAIDITPKYVQVYAWKRIA